MGIWRRSAAVAAFAAATALTDGAGLAQVAQTAPPLATVQPSGQATLRTAAPQAPAPRPAAGAGAANTPTIPQTTAAGRPLDPAQLEAFVDGAVREAMAAEHIAGVAVSVVHDGQVVLKKGYGLDRLSPARAVDPDRTLFRIGSISKTFTWIAVMREVEAGRIRLNAPVNVYLPQKDQVKDAGGWRQITMRDLMTHTPGFEDRALGQLFEKDPRRIRPIEQYLRQERPARVRAPGVLPTYSNYGVLLAGVAASQVAGRPYQDLIDAEILRPLSMARTTFREPYPARAGIPAPMPANLTGDISQGYRWTGAGYSPRPFEYATQIAPAGSASSTAGDMARYMTMILDRGTLDGQTVYGPGAAKAFRTTLQRSAPGVLGWQHGFMEYALPGGYRGYGHGGATLSFHSAMVTVPDLNLGVFVTTNTETGRAFARRLPELIVGRFFAPPPGLPPAGDKALWDRRDTYAGRYLTTRRPYHGMEKFVSLFTAQARVAVTRDGRLITTEGGRSQAWVPTSDPAVFRQVDGPDTVAFQIKDGRAQRWYAPWGGAAFERAGPLTDPKVLNLAAVLAMLCAVATLVGLAIRDRRELRESTWQKRGSALQTAASILFLLAGGCFVMWTGKAADVAAIFYDWPGWLLLIAAAAGFVAALLTLISLIILPQVWTGGRRLDSWGPWRKLRYTFTSLAFALLAALLFAWGGLLPLG
jgi:CubicO group peptidase (beta-lactamase class C family)